MTADNGGAKVDLGVLEEDDEFEEFPTDGKRTRRTILFHKVQSFWCLNVFVIHDEILSSRRARDIKSR